MAVERVELEEGRVAGEYGEIGCEKNVDEFEFSFEEKEDTVESVEGEEKEMEGMTVGCGEEGKEVSRLAIDTEVEVEIEGGAEEEIGVDIEAVEVKQLAFAEGIRREVLVG